MEFKTLINKTLNFIKIRAQIFIFFISVISILFVFLNLVKNNLPLGVSNQVFLDTIFTVPIFLSSIYVILFLPSYPIFFIILRKYNFNILEKVSFTIIANLAFYILIGYFGNILKFPLTGEFFFYGLISFYCCLILSIGVYKFIKGDWTIFFSKETFSQDRDHVDLNISFKSVKKSVEKNLNAILLIIFLILVCILNFIRFSYWYGTDAMYHAVLIKAITSFNELPNSYYGALGLHIFGSVIYFFSGVDIIFIPRYFLFYTIPVSAIILYNIFIKIFNNKNLAFFGIFILEFSVIGFSNMMYQFWPTGLALIQCLMIFYILYVRFLDRIKTKRPTREDIFSKMGFSYIFIIFIFLSSVFTHPLITVILILSFLFVYFIFFLNDFKRGIDFLLLAGLMGIFLIIYSTGLISSQFFLIQGLTLPWYILLLVGIGGAALFWIIKKTVHYSPEMYSLVINGEKKKYYKTIEDKVVIPLTITLILLFLIVFFMINDLFLNINSSRTLIGLDIFILYIFGIWGLYLYQKTPRGKNIALWLLGLILIWLAAYAIDIFISHEFWSGRILLLPATAVIIGFVSYFYKLIKTSAISSLKIKIFIFLFISFMFFSHFYDELVNVDDIQYSLMQREVYPVQWMSNHIDDRFILFAQFGMSYVFLFYDYPFDETGKPYNDSLIAYFIPITRDYFNPADHFVNGTNILQQIKEQYNMDFYIILVDRYLSMVGFETYRTLTPNEVAQYYNMSYLNKICSSVSESGAIFPFYWVI